MDDTEIGATVPDATPPPAPPPQAPVAAAAPAPAAPAPSSAGFALPNLAAAQQFFTDPTAMAGAAKIFFKHGMPEGMEWLKQGHLAARENVFQAAQYLLAGDGDAAVQAFNKSGQFTDATGATKNDDGTWTITRASGQAVTVNPQQQMASLLSPKDFFAQQELAKRTAIEAAAQKSTEAYHTGYIGALNNRAADQLEIANVRKQAMEGAAQIRADAATEIAKARAEGGQKLNELYSKFGPKATWDAAFSEATKGGAAPEVAQASADRAMLANPFNPVRVTDDGQVNVMDPFNETRPLRTFPTVAEYETYVGHKLPVAPKAAAPAATPAKATTTTQRTLPQPMSVQDARAAYAEKARRTLSDQAAASSAADQAVSDFRSQFDADRAAMKPEDLAAKYKPQRAKLSREQAIYLNKMSPD
jgi:hypothetical protein